MRLLFMVASVLLISSSSFAQVPEPFGSVCDPAVDSEIYEAMVQWYNSNRYDNDEVAKVDVESFKKQLKLETLQSSFQDGKHTYEVFRFEFLMGDEIIGTLATVYASANGNKQCTIYDNGIGQYL